MPEDNKTTKLDAKTKAIIEEFLESGAALAAAYNIYKMNPGNPNAVIAVHLSVGNHVQSLGRLSNSIGYVTLLAIGTDKQDVKDRVTRILERGL